MSFGFVQIGFLLGLAAIGIPLLLHLLRGHKPVLVELGTVRFLRSALDRSAGRARLLRWLLMALRIVAVMLLAALFARPYFVAAARGGSGSTLVVLVDRSASMQLGNGKRRLVELAAEQAADLLESLAPGSAVHVAWFDSQVRPLAKPGDSANTPRELAAQLRKSAAARDQWSGTNYLAALAWGRDLCARSAGPAELHVFSDFRRAPVESNLPAMPADLVVQLHDVGHDLADNLAIAAASVDSTWIRPNRNATVDFTIVNQGALVHEDVPVSVELVSSGEPVKLRTTISLQPGETSHGQFELPALSAGLWQGSVTIELPDAMNLDNERSLALLAAPPQNVLVLAGAESADKWDAAHFLKRAVQPIGAAESPAQNPYRASVVRLGQGDSLPSLRDAAAVIVADADGVTASVAESLRRFVAEGGGLLVFASPEPCEGDRCLVETALGMGELVSQQSLEPAARLERWQVRHALLAPFADPQNADLRRIAFRRQTVLRPATDVVVLAELPGASPWMAERRLELGKVLWIGAPCDQEANDLLRSRLFLPLVHQSLGYLIDIVNGPINGVEVGTPSDLPLDAGPGVTKVGRTWRVANVATEELADSQRWTREEFAQQFALPWKSAHDSPARAGETTADDIGEQSELWPYAAIALLAVLCCEFMVANRTVA